MALGKFHGLLSCISADPDEGREVARRDEHRANRLLDDHAP